jgi:hypothetical protein
MPRTSDADVDTRSQLEARKRTLLSNVERALLDALAESPDVHRSIWRLQKAGFTLRLSIECHEAHEAKTEKPAEPAPATSATFRIDAEDLGFLRSIGIDPTRRTRPRRRA